MAAAPLAGLALGAGVLSAGISGFGALRAGSAAQQAANYRAQVATNYAQFARQKGMVDAQAHGFRVGNLLAKQENTQAASGLDINSGSNLDVRESSAKMGRLDELTILSNAENKARGLETEAQFDYMKGAQAAEEAKWNFASSILGGVSSVSNKWAAYKQQGIF